MDTNMNEARKNALLSLTEQFRSLGYYIVNAVETVIRFVRSP